MGICSPVRRDHPPGLRPTPPRERRGEAILPSFRRRGGARSVTGWLGSQQASTGGPHVHFMTGMDHRTVRANGIKINLWTGGNGPPVLLLHGYPQTGQMWRKVAPKLAEHYTVVCPD